MLEKLGDFSKDELVKGSLTLFVMINISNLLSYIFHFLMARMLGPPDYGVLAVLMSIIYIFTVPNEAIQTVVSRLISKFNPKKEFGKMKFIFSKTIRKGLKVATVCFILFIPISFFLIYFLSDISFFHFILTGVILFSLFTAPVVRGVLQGRKKFKELGWSMIIESVSKLIIAVFLVFIGLKVYGAVMGVIFSIFFSLLISLFFLKEISYAKRTETKTEGIYAYSQPIIITIFVVMVMFSLDIIIAKRFFSSELAGKYAVASMLGKMIFLGVIPISKAMFPIASEDAEKGNKKSSSFYKSLILILIPCLIAVVAFFIVPELMIKILFGTEYTDIKNILGIIGLAFSFLAIANLILLYHLSLNKKTKPISLIIFPVIQILLLFIFHKTTLQFALALMFSNFILLLFSLFILCKK